MISTFIHRRFGTTRGAVRLGLSYVELTARLAPVRHPAPTEVNRLVFVCHGNICRSAYAEAVARKMGMRAASFGLSTTSGRPAHPPVLRMAQERGLDLTTHRTTAAEDFVPLPGDLLLAMEVRHLRRLARLDGPVMQCPRGLLGRYATVPVPHLHDPYELSPAYLPVCLDRMDDAITRLGRLFPNARAA